MDFASLMMAEFPGIQPYNYASMSNHINTMNNQVMQQFNPINGHDGTAFSNAMNAQAHERTNGMSSQVRQSSASDSNTPDRDFADNDADQPFQCPTCFKRFSRQGQLTRHMQSHFTGQGKHLNSINNPERPFQCPTCFKRFPSQAQLAKHAQIHFPGLDKPINDASTPNRSFASESVMEKNKDSIHQNAEVKEEEPVNPFLQMALETAREIKEEKSKKERLYQCSSCLKRFLSSNHLKRHLRSKTHLSGQCRPTILVDKLPGEGTQQVFGPNGAINGPAGPSRPFSCQICNKRFTTQNHLKRHGDVHFGVKRFSCDICHKTFLRSENLNIHMRTHSGLKPFKCSICGKGFSQPSNVKNHEKTHSNFRKFQCAICLKAFKIKTSLKLHMKTMHNTLI